MFHSGPSRSSIEMNVGSPPIVKRTSLASSCASTVSPSTRICCQVSSVYGFAGLTSPLTRRTLLA